MTDSPDRLLPSARALADAAADSPSLAEIPLTEARAAVARMAVQFGAGDPVASVEDVEVTAAHGSVRCRVYRPHALREVPPLLWMHAGGWCTGDLTTSDALCRRLASRIGCPVMSVDYRLAPEHPFPAALDDVQAAARWLARFASRASTICVGGDSAGGNLAAAYCVMASDDPLIDVAGQLLLFPAVDLRGGHPSEAEFARGYFATTDEFTTWIGHYLAGQHPAQPLASPLHAEPARLPPAVVVTAECDPFAMLPRPTRAGWPRRAPRFACTGSTGRSTTFCFSVIWSPKPTTAPTRLPGCSPR